MCQSRQGKLREAGSLGLGTKPQGQDRCVNKGSCSGLRNWGRLHEKVCYYVLWVFLKRFIFMNVCVCAHMCKPSWSLEEEVGFAGARVMGSCILPHVGARNWTTLFCEVISPAPYCFKNTIWSRVWWLIFLILAAGRQSKAHLCELETSLVSVVSSRSLRARWLETLSKMKQTNKTNKLTNNCVMASKVGEQVEVISTHACDQGLIPGNAWWQRELTLCNLGGGPLTSTSAPSGTQGETNDLPVFS